MSLKEKIISYLLENQQHSISGQKLASLLDVSRNAIWKQIEALREDGYDIRSVPGQGYQLKRIKRQLDPVQIDYFLNPTEPINIQVYNSVTSTNDVIKDLLNNEKRPIVCVTEQQTKGKGRRGRSYEMSDGKGLYLSIAVTPNTINTEDISIYTLLAAVSTLQTIQQLTPFSPKVKWVNDLFLNGRKICGILSELVLHLENNDPAHVIVGIGINLSGDFSKAHPDIANIAGTLFGEKLPDEYNPNEFIATLVRNFLYWHEQLPRREFLTIYREEMLGRGQHIYYLEKGEKYHGVLKDIDETGALLVEQSDGTTERLIGQEISLSSQQFTH